MQKSKLKYSIFILTFFFCVNMNAQDVLTLRDAFKVASQSKEQSQKFLELAEDAYSENKSAVKQGYLGVALAVSASFSKNIFTKIGDFNKGKKMIDQAIEVDDKNIELRLIRLSIQANAPKIAGYYRNIDEDKDFIKKNLSNVNDPNLKQFIQGFIDDTDVF